MGEVETLAGGEPAHRGGLRLAVQHVADEMPGVHAVLGLGDRAEGAGERQPVGQDAGELDRRRGHQPDPLSGVHVQPGQGVRARPDLARHLLVVDLLAQRDELLDLLAGDEGQRRLARGGHVPGVLPAEPQPGLPGGEAHEVAPGEEVAGRQALREVEDRRADHHRVVDVEERGGGRIGWDGEGGVEFVDRLFARVKPHKAPRRHSRAQGSEASCAASPRLAGAEVDVDDAEVQPQAAAS